VRAAVDVIRPSADAKRIAVSVAVADVHLILADPGRLQQMFWNLLTNAVKFTPEGGHIGIAVSQRGSNVAIEVRDSGRGIDPVFLPHVFERFRQHDGSTTRHYGGLGLGLAIVRELAELHGGTVTATSEGLGKGACFTIELSWRSLISAATDQESLGSRLSPIPSNATSARLHGVRVLLIDDDPDSREIAALVLGDRGAQVDTAQSGKLALIQLATQLPDVIVCDIGMPEMDGYELMRQVRALPPGAGGGIPAIALTGYVREQDVRIAFAAGFQHHIPKPVDFAALVDAIARLRERA